MKTHTESVPTGRAALQLAELLIERSAWFQMEPRPDGEYAITVKSENATIIQTLAKSPHLINKSDLRAVAQSADRAEDIVTIDPSGPASAYRIGQ